MLLDKNGRVFGKINMIDLLMIVFILSIVIMVFMRMKLKSTINKPLVEVCLKCKIKSIDEKFSTNIGKSAPIYLKNEEESFGRIVEITENESLTFRKFLNGKVKEFAVPRRFDLYLNIDSKLKEGEFSYFSDFNEPICVNKTLKARTKYAIFDLEILDIKKIQ